MHKKSVCHLVKMLILYSGKTYVMVESGTRISMLRVNLSFRSKSAKCKISKCLNDYPGLLKGCVFFNSQNWQG